MPSLLVPFYFLFLFSVFRRRLLRSSSSFFYYYLFQFHSIYFKHYLPMSCLLHLLLHTCTWIFKLKKVYTFYLTLLLASVVSHVFIGSCLHTSITHSVFAWELRKCINFVLISNLVARSAVSAGKTLLGGRVSGRRTGRDNGQMETFGSRWRIKDYR